MSDKHETKGSKLKRRTFLKGTVASTVVGAELSGATGLAAADGERFVVEQDGTYLAIEGLQGKPSYDVGRELGVFVWHDGSDVHLRWTGDSYHSDGVYVVEYDVRTDGTFSDVSKVSFDWAGDFLLDQTDSKVRGRNAFGGGYDGLDLTLEDATELKLDIRLSEDLGRDHWGSLSRSEKEDLVLNVETYPDPDHVFLGGDRRNPDAIPVTLSVTEEPRKYEVTPLSYDDLTVEEFYDNYDAQSHTPTGLERSDVSQLFLYEDPDGTLSLVVLHDKPNDGSGGAVTFQFAGLPTDEGRWIVPDDGHDFDSDTDTSPDWAWNRYKTDGGVFQGGFDDGVDVTIDPAFNEAASSDPFTPGEITTWQVLSGDAENPNRFALDMIKPVTIRSGGDPTPASVADVTLPPTAVETGEEPSFAVTVDPGSHSPDDVGVEAIAELSRRGDHVGSATASVTSTRTDDGLVRFEASIPSASLFTSSPEGVGFETAIRVLADGQEVASFDARTFAFQEVDRVAAVAAHASDTTPSRSGRDLFEFVRRRAEFVNEHYASGLGNMGAKGFDVELLNERHSDTGPLVTEWHELPKQKSEYETQDPDDLPDENVREFVRESLQAFNPSGGVDVADYDTGMVINPEQLSLANWQGSILPTARFEIPEIGLDIRTPTELPGIDIAPYDLADGEQIDAIYATIDDDAWSHEFGHAMGPGLEVGFPEMYKMTNSFNNFGNIGNWGVMGGGTHNDVVSAFVRGFVGDQWYDIDNWIGWNTDLHVKDDVTMALEKPLSEFELGDDAQLLLSAYFEFAVVIEVDYPDLGELDPGIDVDIREADPQFGIYVLENREGKPSGIVDLAHDELVTAPPTTKDGTDYQKGVALYRFDILHFDEFDVDLGDVLDPEVNVEIGTDSLQLDFLPENPAADPATEDDPTKISLSSGHRTYEDRVSGSKFELTKTRYQGGPEVTVKREVEELVDVNGELISDVVTFVVDRLDEFEDRLREAFSGVTSGGARIPKFDVYAETPDGRRAGTDPETGEVVEEIEGARVVQTMTWTVVSVPASSDVTFEVSDARLRSFLESAGVEVPEPVAYDRTVILDNDPEIVERDGTAYIDGRTVQRGPAAVGDDGQPALQSVPVDVDPARINAKSNGQFVTAFVGVGSLDPEKLLLESVALEQVSAVTDEQYGFVKNPPTRTRDGETFVMVKFPRDRVVEQLGTGTHEVQLSGLVENVTVYGTTEATVFESGNGNDGNGNGGNGNGGN